MRWPRSCIADGASCSRRGEAIVGSHQPKRENWRLNCLKRRTRQNEPKRKEAPILVLGREKNERIRLTVNGVVIWLAVTDIERNKVRIGITAPREVVIEREELIVKPTGDNPCS